MQRLSWVVLSLVFAAGAFANPRAPNPRTGHWSQMQAERFKHPVAWSFRDDVPAAERTSRPHLLVVSWHVSDMGDDGNVDPKSLAAFSATEQRLVTAAGAQADLVAVLDYDQQHDWYFLVADPALAERVRTALSAAERAATEVRVEQGAAAEFLDHLAATAKNAQAAAATPAH